MKKSVLTVTSIFLAITLTLTTATAILIKSHVNSIDLVQKVTQLQSEDHRDDALVLAKTFKDHTGIHSDELAKLHDQLKYSTAEKFKSALWNGMMKGEVYDHYSGLGAISAEMCLWSDIRDFAIKGYSFIENHFGNPNPIIHPGLVKTTVKYLDRIPKPPNTGLVRQLVSGGLEPINEQKVWQLFKKTTGPSQKPRPFSPAFFIRNTSTPHPI